MDTITVHANQLTPADVIPMPVHDHVLVSADLNQINGKHIIVHDYDKACPAVQEMLDMLANTGQYLNGVITVKSVKFVPSTRSYATPINKSELVKELAEQYGKKVIDFKFSQANPVMLSEGMELTADDLIQMLQQVNPDSIVAFSDYSGYTTMKKSNIIIHDEGSKGKYIEVDITK